MGPFKGFKSETTPERSEGPIEGAYFAAMEVLELGNLFLF
jgi:hypothetical protein